MTVIEPRKKTQVDTLPKADSKKEAKAVEPKLNKFALMAFVFSLTSMLWWANNLFAFLSLVLFPLSIIFGHIGLRQSDRNFEAGYGLARTALIIGYISLGLMVLAGLIGLFVWGVWGIYQWNAAGPDGVIN